MRLNKNYNSKNEEVSMKNYLINKEIVEEHNKKYELGEVSFKLELNKFADKVRIKKN